MIIYQAEKKKGFISNDCDVHCCVATLLSLAVRRSSGPSGEISTMPNDLA